VYELAALQVEDRDMTTPGLSEFTASRASVVVPFTPDMEKFGRVKASWLFPCAGSLMEPEDGSGNWTTKVLL
jgi:hypothetical protein